MKALLLDAANRTATLSTLPLPNPGPNELLIAVKAIALNLIDAQCTASALGSTGRVIGSDFAGLVVARGTPASPSHNNGSTNNGNGSDPYHGRLQRSSTATVNTINRGDRVAGFLQGSCGTSDSPGAFAEYIVCPADLVWRVPASLPLEDAATTSLCGLAAAQGLFLHLGLTPPFQWEDESDEGVLRRVESETSQEDAVDGDDEEKEVTFFVAGASTSVGMYVSQLVRRSAEASGRRVRLIGTASPQQWDMLRAEPYGYDVLVDYRDTSWPEKVRAASRAEGGVDFAYDAISEGSTVRNVSHTLKKGGNMAVVRSREAGVWDPEGVQDEPLYGAVWEGLGEDMGSDKAASVRSGPVKRSFAAAFFKWLSDGGLLLPNPTRIMPGGLERVVEDGFTLLGTSVSNRSRERKERQDHMRPISGEKLVYRIETTRRGSISTGEGLVG